jgi:hypothetical protein
MPLMLAPILWLCSAFMIFGSLCAQGYALIEYETKAEAQAAIDGMNGKKFMEQTVKVDWAFSSGPLRRYCGEYFRTEGEIEMYRKLLACY